MFRNIRSIFSNIGSAYAFVTEADPASQYLQIRKLLMNYYPNTRGLLHWILSLEVIDELLPQYQRITALDS